MKRSYLAQIIGSGVLAASLAVLPSIPAQAQNNTVPDTNNNAPVQDQGQTRGERNFSWGWLGLLGLAGLAGLNRRPEEAVDYKEPDQINSPVTPVTNETVRYKEPDEINSPVTLVTNEKAARYIDPNENNGPLTTEKAVRYIDPNETKLPDTDGRHSGSNLN